MASISDVYKEIKSINNNLQVLHNDMNELKTSVETVTTSVDNVNNTLISGFNSINSTLNDGFANISLGIQALISLGIFSNQALVHNLVQNDTMICDLEKISNRICHLLNEAHLQTGYQLSINSNTSTLQDLYKATHADAAMAYEQHELLRKQIHECCPPNEPQPICQDEPCEVPRPFDKEFVKPKYKPFKPEIGPR
ncbi:hypothetical protein LAV92_22420 [Bacillus cereus]|uniref:hypothetical protein n=1 Tax=Bacillus cereus TaxID=1396 RepID=UPI0023E3C849|nr:hypothetical protein [Bacillus cereus]MDF3554505.1 hypothetical protein [Bacillus cereus]